MITNNKINSLYILLVILLISLIKCINTDLKSLLPSINKIIQIGKQNLWIEIQKDQPIWNMPSWLGSSFISEYYFFLSSLNITQNLDFNSKFDKDYFATKIIKQQQKDGSWKQLTDLNRKQGLLDPTINNYWYLKNYGISQDSDILRKARKFILDHGGLENAQVMTKYKLALFGQYQWHLIPYIPLFLFKKTFPYNYFKTYIKDYVAQWIYPHLTGLAYLRYHKTIFPISKVCLSQLRVSRSDHCEEVMRQKPGITGFQKQQYQDSDINILVEEIISLKGSKGLFGGYTVSTLINLLAFKDYSLRYPQNDYSLFYERNVGTSLKFVQDLYFNPKYSYNGTLDDGRYWDTLLSVMALLQVGQDVQKIQPSIEFLIQKALTKDGGIPFGLQFQQAPDIDDTSIFLIVLGKLKKLLPNKNKFYQQKIQKTYQWIIKTQNLDGGFPAFDKDKNDNQYKLISLIFKLTQVDGSAEIFDPSCPDITGHILEGFGEIGKYDLNIVIKAIQYLFNSQKNDMWQARWAINYIFAMGSVIPGLSRIGFDLDKKWIHKSIQKLRLIQQNNGGFGEDSQSYNTKKYIQGVATVSMTAWGLFAYIEVAHIEQIDDNILKAAQFLIKTFEENHNKFYDISVIGTGHRGLLNMQYPIYAYTFPLMALGRLKQYIEGTKKSILNKDLNLAYEAATIQQQL